MDQKRLGPLEKPLRMTDISCLQHNKQFKEEEKNKKTKNSSYEKNEKR
jgi:hypothetical protein